VKQEVVVITGASRGIGAATARLLGGAGYRLALLARSGDEMQRLVDEMQLPAAQYLLLAVDLTQTEKLPLVIEQIKVHFGRIDVLVNNAGIGKFGPLEQIGLLEVEQLFKVNVLAPFALSQAVLPHFRANERGTFVNVLSDAARRTFAGGTAYCATKYAQDGLFGSMRAELEGTGIAVCNLYPGLVNTHFNNKQPREARAGVLEPEQVAEAILQAMKAPEAHQEIWLKAD
jgi:NADP-dependent 3-hydroxy acid dehydrogenase YdfG